MTESTEGVAHQQQPNVMGVNFAIEPGTKVQVKAAKVHGPSNAQAILSPLGTETAKRHQARCAGGGVLQKAIASIETDHLVAHREEGLEPFDDCRR